MKILFAAPDRDLLACYKKLLGSDFGEIVTAFDGTQICAILSEESFNLAILDRDLPRIDHKTILARIREKNIPVIVLTNDPHDVGQFSREPSPNAYLSYPFTESRLADVVRAVFQRSDSGSGKDETGERI